MRKVIGLLVLVGLLSFVPVKSYSADLKIGYIDIFEIFNEYDKTKEYDKSLEKRKDGIEGKLKDKKEIIESLQNKMTLLKEGEKAKEEEEMNKEMQDFNELQRKAYTDIKKERDEKMKEIIADIDKIVKEYAKKNKYSLIFEKNSIHYGVDKMDLTDDILKIANKEYKKKK